MLAFFLSLASSAQISLNQKSYLSTLSPTKFQQTCPSITYSQSLNTTCFYYSNSIYTLSDCPSNYTCKFSLKYPSNSICTQESPQTLYSDFAYEEYLLCNSTSDCASELFCASVCTNSSYCEQFCIERSMYTCSHIDECIYGNVCNNSMCISAFTIPDGQPADNKLACISGIISEGICQSPITTDGVIMPKKCENDKDCLASDKKTEGKCICLPEVGNYCELHDSDSLKLDFLQASFESRIKDAHLLFLRIYYYPVLELDYKWPEYLLGAEEFQLLKEAGGLLIFFNIFSIF
jgi:hypothetical protein